MSNDKCQVVKILENKKLSDKYFKLSFISPWPAKSIKAGQFIEVRINDGFSPLLRKPFSVHRIREQPAPASGARGGPGRTARPGMCGKGRAGENREQIEVLYEVVGEGTEQLSKKKPSEILDIIGPLGNGFSLISKLSTINYILVAGGIGAAPLMALAEKLMLEHKVQSTARPGSGHTKRAGENRVIVLIGANTKEKILCEKEFKKLGCDVKISTDDGSKGHKGFVTELLKKLPATDDQRPATIYACGPKPMLKEVVRIATQRKIPCQVLLEEYMACGIGVCLGCAVKTKGGYKMVCKDGPVFEASEIIWE